ncbi:hypothetical protein EGT07_12275 [Herbaspirillum sp. HC18]|nr:hypothetical protein EGT07_12275 [Herbaspirillum sp. HC18]
MISDNAKQSIDRIFIKAAKTRLVRNSSDSCEVTKTDAKAVTALDPHEIVVLTISSILYRLLLFFHLEDDDGLRQYFSAEAGHDTFREEFLEIANLSCGAMNQELVRYFPDLGMSTPYILGSACLPHLEDMKPGYVGRYELTLNGSVRLFAMVCVFEHTEIDFDADTRESEETAGELELF